MSLIPVQSSRSSRGLHPSPLCDRTVPAASCSFVSSLITLEWKNINSKYESPWAKSQRKSVLYQSHLKNACHSNTVIHVAKKVFVDTFLFKWYFYSRIVSQNAQKKQNILSWWQLYQLRTIVPCSTRQRLRKCHFSSIEFLVLQKAFCILSFPDRLLHLWCTNCFVHVHDSIQLVCICLKIYTNVSATVLYCPRIKELLYFGSLVTVSGSCCISATVTVKLLVEGFWSL